jgi:hypothetical protein
MNRCPKLAAILGCLLMAATANSSGEEAKPLMFKAGAAGEFTFDTGLVRGKLREGGASKGLSQVIHSPTGQRLDSSMGLFSHYRVFTQGHRYGVGAWDWPSRADLEADGSVSVRWAANSDRPFEMKAHYRWVAPDTLDLETTVTTKTNLKKFESFLASYFTPLFTNTAVCAGTLGKFTTASKEAGMWQAFPRDAAASLVIKDGRWQLEPNPVAWVLMPEFSKALAFRRAPSLGITAALISDPRGCFAICTPYETESHYSTYLSLFGQDIQAGESATARARMTFHTSLSEQDLFDAYLGFTRR